VLVEVDVSEGARSISVEFASLIVVCEIKGTSPNRDVPDEIIRVVKRAWKYIKIDL
jgi:hypothetical protein